MVSMSLGHYIMIFISGLCTNARRHQTPYFVGGSDEVDFVTSRERCSQYGGMLARFNPAFFLYQHMGLEPNNSYWIEAATNVNSASKLTCESLQVGVNIRKLYLVNSNCSSKYRFICAKTETSVLYNRTKALSSTESQHLLSQTENGDIGQSFTTETTSSLSVSYMTNDLEVTSVTTPNTTLSSEGETIPTSENVSYYKCTKNKTLFKTTDHIQTTCTEVMFHYLCVQCQNHLETLLNTGNFTQSYNLSNTANLNLFPELEIHAKDTSKSHRKRTSASDPRPSTRAIGLVASFVIGSVVMVIVMLDLPVIISQIRRQKCDNAKLVSEC